jgi:hypothetical protein
MVQPKRRIIICLLVLAIVLGSAGCAAGSASSRPEETKAAEMPVAGNQEILNFLKASKDELELIDKILTDKDLGILEDETGSEEELNAEFIEKYERILTGYVDQIHEVLSDVGRRTVPDLPDLISFQTAEKHAFQTLESILLEYSQTLSYAGVILQVIESLNDLDNIQEYDLQAIYNAYSACIGDAITALEAASIPSFLESFNANFIDAFRQMDDAVFYSLRAVAIDDPVRADAGEYLMDIMARNLDKISLDWERDMADRQDALMEDALAVQKTYQGLTAWLDTNIGNLSGKYERV